jgi:hypothetical protein
MKKVFRILAMLTAAYMILINPTTSAFAKQSYSPQSSVTTHAADWEEEVVHVHHVHVIHTTIAFVEVSTAAVRACPSTDCLIVGHLFHGAVVHVHFVQGEWANIGGQLWTHTSVLSIGVHHHEAV